MQTTEGVKCPKCFKAEIVTLARDGDIQRYQCSSCWDNFQGPAEPISPDPVTMAPAPISYVPISAPEHAGSGTPCPKGCGKIYLRLGKKFETHASACDGTPAKTPVKRNGSVAAHAPARPFEPQAPSVQIVPVAAGTLKAFDLSIEAMKAQRQALEAEIHALDAAITTMEKLRGAGGSPAVPFVGGE